VIALALLTFLILLVQSPPGIRMYRRLEPEPPGPLRLRIGMRGSLNRDIELVE
jgi:hypothetical protein